VVIGKLCGLYLSSVTISVMDQVEGVRRGCKSGEKFRTKFRLENITRRLNWTMY
jgi:hypothetical protein